MKENSEEHTHTHTKYVHLHLSGIWWILQRSDQPDYYCETSEFDMNGIWMCYINTYMPFSSLICELLIYKQEEAVELRMDSARRLIHESLGLRWCYPSWALQIILCNFIRFFKHRKRESWKSWGEEGVSIYRSRLDF